MSSGFISETEAAEARQKRQEEWEKVRTPDQPLERPEEPYDGRTLYDRLKEQKMKKDMEYEETHKLKNLIRGLDDDEVQFLELVDQSKIDAEKKQLKEEEAELKEFRNRVATLQEESVNKKIQSEIKQHKPKSTTSTIRPTQKSLLSIGIKRKIVEQPISSNKKAKSEEQQEMAAAMEVDNNNLAATTATDATIATVASAEVSSTASDNSKQLLTITTNKLDRGELKCVAILPGIGPYTESSDSELSSGSDDEPDIGGQYDLVGRKRQKKRCLQEE